MHDREWEARERKLDEIKRGKRMPTIAELRDLAVRHDGFVDLSGESAEITDAERQALNEYLGNDGGIAGGKAGETVVEGRGRSRKAARGASGGKE